MSRKPKASDIFNLLQNDGILQREDDKREQMHEDENGEEVIESITINFQGSSVVDSSVSYQPSSILRNKKNRHEEDYLIKKTIEVLNETSELNEKDNGYLDADLEDLPVDLLKHCEVILNEYPDLTDESILSTEFTNLICSRILV